MMYGKFEAQDEGYGKFEVHSLGLQMLFLN